MHEYEIIHCLFNIIYCIRATILQHESSQFGKVNTESVAKPAVIRAGAEGWFILIYLFIKIKINIIFAQNNVNNHNSNISCRGI
jgi:hypothetical protein